MDLRPVGFIFGYLVMALAGAMVLPVGVSLLAGDGEWPAFAGAMGASVFVGGMLILGLRPEQIAIDRRQGFVITSLAWAGLPLFGALPLLWSGLDLSLTDAVFESVSGLTTTGSTVLAGLDGMAPSLLMWRSMLQWVGGIGIIAMGIAILPFLRVGGMQVFRMESSDRSDKVVPKASQFTLLLIGIYVGLTALCAIAYGAAGMTAFQAVNHAMTTISTGGYATSDLSMGYFSSPTIHWLATLFMLSGALPFVLYIQALRGRPLVLVNDGQVQALIGLLVMFTVALALWLAARTDLEFLVALRLAAFNVTSVVTTTGYATSDYMVWGTFAIVAFYFLTFVGGCSGSTSGGFKIYRFQVIAQLFALSGRRMLTPHGIFYATYGGKPIDEDVVQSVATFMILFVTTILILALALGLMGLDIQTAFSGAATAVANVGPGIGPIIGPAGNFSSLPDAAKWLLCVGMVLGRLEIVTMAVLLVPDFWKP